MAVTGENGGGSGSETEDNGVNSSENGKITYKQSKILNDIWV